MQTYYWILRNNPKYARLWTAQAISLLGDWFSTIALSALVSTYSNGSGIAVGGLLLARFFPPLLIGPYAGVLADRLNRKHLMIVSDVARFGIVLGFLLATDASRLWLIYALSIVQFTFSALFEPAQSSIVPSLVREQDLVKANLLGSVTWSAMLAAGAAIGGLVNAAVGTPAALVIDSTSFLLSALITSTIPWKPVMQAVAHRVQAQPGFIGSVRHAVRGFTDGLEYLRHHPRTAAVLLIKLGGNIGSSDTIMIIYATQIFVVGENGAGSLGLMYAAFGVGAIVGPVILEHFNNGSIRTMRRFIVIGYVCLSIAWFALAGAPSLALCCLALFIRAMGGSTYWTYSSVMIQKLAPDEFLGRLFSLDMIGFRITTVLSIAITGLLVGQAGDTRIRVIVIGTGIVSLVPLALWTLGLPWMEREDVAVAEGVAGR